MPQTLISPTFLWDCPFNPLFSGSFGGFYWVARSLSKNFCHCFMLCLNLIFSGTTCTILHLKICLESQKYRLFNLFKALSLKNYVLKSKMMRKVKKRLGSAVKLYIPRDVWTSIANVAIFYYRNLSFFCFRLKKQLNKRLFQSLKWKISIVRKCFASILKNIRAYNKR
jgi:predicted nucleic acid-binding Zn finger protein